MPSYENELAQIVAELNRTAQNSREAAEAQISASLDQLLLHAGRQGASDVLLISGAPVTLRINGALSPGAGPALAPEDTRSLLLPLLTPAQGQDLQRTRSADLCFTRPGIGRFRANVHHQRGTVAGSIRLLPEKIPTLESLHLPPTLRHCAEARQGLVLITGPTGCGKSSTLAALLELINTIAAIMSSPLRIRSSSCTQPYLHHRADRSRPRHARFRQLAARHPAADSGRHPGGRDARPGNDLDRAHRRGNRAPGAVDHAHQRHLAGRFAHSRFVSRRQSAADPAAAFAGPAGGGRPAIGARHRTACALPGGGNSDRDRAASAA